VWALAEAVGWARVRLRGKESAARWGRRRRRRLVNTTAASSRPKTERRLGRSWAVEAGSGWAAEARRLAVTQAGRRVEARGWGVARGLLWTISMRIRMWREGQRGVRQQRAAELQGRTERQRVIGQQRATGQQQGTRQQRKAELPWTMRQPRGLEQPCMPYIPHMTPGAKVGEAVGRGARVGGAGALGAGGLGAVRGWRAGWLGRGVLLRRGSRRRG
jgi:hypothetical protein